jgi:hypothetical protein
MECKTHPNFKQLAAASSFEIGDWHKEAVVLRLKGDNHASDWDLKGK